MAKKVLKNRDKMLGLGLTFGILFGVIIENVKEAKLCSVASNHELFFTLLVKVFHFLISKKWLIIVKKSIKMMFFDEKTPKSIIFV